ncbi:MAG TPA: hypothetical protein VIS56_02885 [Candidatus Saccharimonadales bacterium]
MSAREFGQMHEMPSDVLQGTLNRIIELHGHMVAVLHRSNLQPGQLEELRSIEASLPDIDDAALLLLDVQELGVEPGSVRVPQAKENRSNLSDDYLRATIADGSDVFMKAVLRPPSAFAFRRISQLSHIVFAQGEVLASRAAAIVDYPMPATQLVRYGGRAWLASKFLEGFDHNPAAGLRHQGEITNQDMLRVRPIFDALIGSLSANPQGMVESSTGRYFAIDAHFMLRGDTDVTMESMLERLVELNGGKSYEFGQDTIGFVGHIQSALEDGRFGAIFEGMLGPGSMSAQLLSSVEARGRAIVALQQQAVLQGN